MRRVIPTTVATCRVTLGRRERVPPGISLGSPRLRPRVETLIPIVAARGEGHVIVVRQIHAPFVLRVR